MKKPKTEKQVVERPVVLAPIIIGDDDSKIIGWAEIDAKFIENDSKLALKPNFVKGKIKNWTLKEIEEFDYKKMLKEYEKTKPTDQGIPYSPHTPYITWGDGTAGTKITPTFTMSDVENKDGADGTFDYWTGRYQNTLQSSSTL